MSDQQPRPHRLDRRREFAEGLAIVVSILLALGIDAWRGERQERAEERELLAGLHAELVENRDQLLAEIELVNGARDRLGAFALGAPDEVERSYVDSAWSSVVMPMRRSYTK